MNIVLTATEIIGNLNISSIYFIILTPLLSSVFHSYKKKMLALRSRILFITIYRKIFCIYCFQKGTSCVSEY